MLHRREPSTFVFCSSTLGEKKLQSGGRPFDNSLSIISDLQGHLTFERKGKGANRNPYSTLIFLYWKMSKSLLANKFADKNISGAGRGYFREIYLLEAFTPRASLRSASNFGKTRFRRFATFDFSTPKKNNRRQNNRRSTIFFQELLFLEDLAQQKWVQAPPTSKIIAQDAIFKSGRCFIGEKHH